MEEWDLPQRLRMGLRKMGSLEGEFRWRHLAALLGASIALNTLSSGIGTIADWLQKTMGVPDLHGTGMVMVALGLAWACLRLLAGNPSASVRAPLPDRKNYANVIVLLSPPPDKWETLAGGFDTLGKVPRWGTAFTAIHEQYDSVKKVWAIGTTDVYPDASCPSFRTLQELITSNIHGVEVNLVSIQSQPNEPAQVAMEEVKQAVEKIYTEQGEHLVTADLTGGTKIMSVGMMLGALDEDRRLTYVNGDTPLVVHTSRDVAVRSG